MPRSVVLTAVMSVALALPLGCGPRSSEEGDSGAARGEPTGTPAPGPRLVLDPTKQDIGTVREGETAEVTILMRNGGDGLLLVDNARAMCSECVQVELDKQELAPGETGRLLVKYSPKDTGPEFTRYIVVQSNSVTGHLEKAMFHGELVPEFDVEPRKVDFGRLAQGETPQAELLIRRNFGGKLRLGRPRDVPEFLEVELPQTRAAAQGQQLRVRVRLSPTAAPRRHKADLELPVNGETRDEVKVRVTADVLARVRLPVTEVFFGTVPCSATAERTVPVVVPEGFDALSLGVASDADYLRARLLARDEGEGARLLLELLPAGQPGPFRAQVRLQPPAGTGAHELTVTCFGVRVE